MSNETSEERDNARNSSVPQEGTGLHVVPCCCDPCDVFVLVLSILCLACVMSLLHLHFMIPHGGFQREGLWRVTIAECVYFLMFPQLCEEGDTSGSQQCNSSICFFNNSAADCISLLVHHQRPYQEGEWWPEALWIKG